MYLHIRGENSQGLVEVIHLHENANGDHNTKDISTWMRELVFSSERELESNAKAINSHDGNRPDQGTYRDVHDRSCFSIARRNVVDHDKREHKDGEAVQEKTCGQQLTTGAVFRKGQQLVSAQVPAYPVVLRTVIFDRQFPHLWIQERAG